MLDRTILVQDATADEMDAYSVTTHADPVATAVSSEEAAAALVVSFATVAEAEALEVF